MTPALIGSLVGHYRLVEQIGAGGKGVVYRAHDERLDRDVAVKILKAGILADKSSRTRFRHEALALSRLSHPNVAVVHDLGSHDDLDYLVMEHVPGTTLNHLASPLPERDVLRVGIQLASGLAAAHAAGVVHRDIKPGNVRVTPDGVVKLLDFGLARRLSRASDQTETASGPTAHIIEGTPPYMAPEQLLGAPPDARSDIYGAGALLYELATGRPPHLPDQLVRLADSVLHEQPPAPRSLNPRLSAGIENVLLKALDRDPARRYQSARELAVDLERLLSPSTPVPLVSPVRPARRLLRFRFAVIAVVGLAALAVWWAVSRRGAGGDVFREGDGVLVADFRNTAGPAFDPLRELLVTALRQSGRVHVFERERALKTVLLMRRTVDAGIDEPTGLDVCRREGVKVLLTGTIERPGAETTRAVVRAVNATTGSILFMEIEALKGEGDLIAAATALGSRIRLGLGESLPGIEASQPLDRVASASTDAVRLYTEAAALFDRGSSAEAATRLQGALGLDPEFAMARCLLARIYRDMGKPGEEQEQLALAFEHRDRLLLKERLLVEAAYYSERERYREARATLQRLVGIYNDDWQARYELATALDANGERGDAIFHMREALRLNPREPRTYASLVNLLAMDGQEEQALRVCDDARKRGAGTPSLDFNEALALFGMRDLRRARAAFERLIARAEAPEHDVLGRIYLMQIELFRGRFASSARDLADSIARDRAAGRGYPERLQRYLLGRIDLAVGRPDLALVEARRLAEGEVKAQHLQFAGILMVRAQERRGVRDVMERLRALEKASPEAFVQACARDLEAEIAFAEGRWLGAEDLFRQAAAIFPDYLPHEGLARVYERTGRWSDAVHEWEAVIGPRRGELFRYGFAADWVLAQLALGAARRRAGDAAGARQALEVGLEAWREADNGEALRRGKEEWRALTGSRWGEPSPRQGNGDAQQQE